MQSLFGIYEREQKLEKISDVLNKLNDIVNWKLFLPLLNSIKPDYNQKIGGRPRYDSVLMFKILILQKYYNLSDDGLEYQINDRISFMKFLNLSIDDRVPDSKTIWKYRDDLTQNKILDKLFKKLIDELKKKRIFLKEGKIIDASLMESPIRRKKDKDEKDSDKENTTNKNSERQIDRDAKWSGAKNKFGYKNHIKVDKKHKFITDYAVSPANEHDSKFVKYLVNSDDSGEEMMMDKAYDSRANDDILSKNKIINSIMKKGRRGKSLTEEEVNRNRKISKERGRIEHVFGWMKRGRHRHQVRAKSELRAKTEIILLNITYNLYNLTRLEIRL